MCWAQHPPSSNFLFPAWIFTGQLAGNTIWIFDPTKLNGWSGFNLDLLSSTFSAPLWLSSFVIYSRGWLNAVLVFLSGFWTHLPIQSLIRDEEEKKVSQRSLAPLKILWFLTACPVPVFSYATIPKTIGRSAHGSQHDDSGFSRSWAEWEWT